jgi:hypothetical protein
MKFTRHLISPQAKRMVIASAASLVLRATSALFHSRISMENVW